MSFKSIKLLLVDVILAAALTSCSTGEFAPGPTDPSSSDTTGRAKITEVQSPTIRKVLESAHEQTRVTRGYTQEYFTMSYPGGDLPPETGACTDVIIRGFRNAGVDLQKEVHEDMAANLSLYPGKWGLTKTDSNIDHRRVPNLQTFFLRKGKALPITSSGDDYKPGDVVSWDLDGKGMTHIGLVSNYWNASSKRYYIIHNIGGGTRAEDRLFEWKITGHFRYF
jgi:uncharacterized protein YijF (DUF1287 family)